MMDILMALALVALLPALVTVALQMSYDLIHPEWDDEPTPPKLPLEDRRERLGKDIAYARRQLLIRSEDLGVDHYKLTKDHTDECLNTYERFGDR